MAATTKVSAYEKRNSMGTTVPMEIDSDPDFNPGAYIEPKQKKKTKRAPKGNGRKRTREESDDDDEFDISMSRPRKKYRPQPESVNPLLQYFAEEEDLALHSASEAEDDDKDDRQDGDDPEDRRHLEIMQRTLRANVKAKKRPSPPPPIEDDSATEDDIDTNSDDCINSKVPLKVAKPIEEEDDSATESEPSDWDKDPVPAGTKANNDASCSETESDVDDDEPIPVGCSMKPRPGFPLKDNQKALGPLVIDEKAGLKIPGPINTYLRDYQRQGVEFFYKQYSEGRGGLLGDDMGLGKTIQVIAFLSTIMRKDGVITDADRRREYVSKLQDGEGWKKRRELPPANTKWPTCLIIAPSTVAQNWERELELWGYFEVGMYTGNAAERKQVLTDFKFGRLDILVTTFDLARMDIDLLDDLPLSCIFVDEAHRLKNVNSKLTQAYHQFKCKARFGLTGTAIQNSYDELHTILDWTNPGKLGTIKQWKGFIQKPLTVGQSANSTPEEEKKACTVAVILRDKIMPNFFLRRTKEIIKDQLPKKIDQVVFCPLSSEQIKAYRRIIGSDIVQNLIHKDEPCICGSKKPRKKCCHPYRPEDVLRYMSILIKLSNHLALILPSEKDSEEQLARNRELSRLIFPDGAPKFIEAVVKSDYCGKWDTLNSLLTKWKKDPTNKVLIFTKSVKLIDTLEFGIKQKNYGFLKLDGSTKQSDRMGIIDQFQTDPNIFIFLISTLAGGTGLNLTSANHVVIFDPNWNPAHDLQAMDRAFRFGQTRDVHVFRLLGAGSLEEMIYARQVYKQQQMAIGYDASIQTRYFEGVQGDPSKQGELFGLKNIFKLHEGTLATKRAIEKATNAEMDWALSNMSPKGRKRPISSEQKKLIEADKSTKEDSLQGLGTLLFDDAVPEAPELNEIQKTLNDIGVHYSHRNEDILAPSKIREQQNKAMLSKTGRARRRASPSKGSGRKGKQVEPAWPSLRPHHIRKKLAAEQAAAANPPEDGMKLFKYFKALVELEYVNTLEELPAWTVNVFSKESKQAQDTIMELLREAMAKLSDDSD